MRKIEGCRTMTVTVICRVTGRLDSETMWPHGHCTGSSESVFESGVLSASLSDSVNSVGPSEITRNDSDRLLARN